MNRLKTALARLEARLQTVVEGGLARLLPSNGLQEELTNGLLRALAAESQTQPNGQRVAPNLFTVSLSPSQSEKINPEARLLDELAAFLEKAASQSNLLFLSPPVVRIQVQANEQEPVQIKAQISLESLTQTSAVLPEAALGLPNLPTAAYLIIDGTRLFPLERSVINIGRRSDNHLVIEDARISRVHAQVRAVNGRYLIFDLDSLGGTFLNNQPIKQSALSPGDVISLAGVPLVYGQETLDLAQTQEVDFHSADDT